MRDPLGVTRKELNATKRIYTFHVLKIGDIEKWDLTIGDAANARRYNALQAYMRRTGKVFVWDSHKYTIERIK